MLERRPGGFALVEVKSTFDVKDAHLPDVAVQVHVLRRAGLDVRRAEVMHLDRARRSPRPEDLFVREDVTARVEELLPAIPSQARAMQRILAGPLPEVAAGERCSAPYECPFSSRCTPAPSILGRSEPLLGST